MNGDRSGSSIIGPLVVGVVLALLVGTSSPWWWGEIKGRDGSDPAPVTAAATGNGGGTSGSGGSSSGGGGSAASGGDSAQEAESPSPPDTASSAVPDDGSCVIEIENPLVTLYEEPDPFGLEAGRAPPGSYRVEEIQTVPFAGSPVRWFRIDADGASGWVEDSSILIASKSGGCS